MPLSEKKIIIIGPAYPYRGGIANFTDSLFDELTKDYSVEIISFKRLYPSFLFPGKTQFEYSNDRANNSKRLIDSLNPINWIKVGRYIKNESPDLLLIMYWLPFFGFCFGKILRVIIKNRYTKTVAICHNIVPHEAHTGDRFMTKYFFSRIDFFVLLSKAIISDLISFTPKAKYVVLPHPIYSKFGTPVEKKDAKNFLKIKDEKVFLFFGFIRDYKGLDILFNSLKLLKDKLDFKLIVAGEFYSNKEKYLNLAEELGIKENLLLFTDFIPTSEVKYYFSAADCVILPYRDATQSGIVQIAMNFNKPVIATNVGGLGEVIENGKTGFIVEKENPEALAGAIKKFYAENREEVFVNNISAEVEKYSWKNFVDGIYQLIH